jgi:hypothetical protein
MAYRETVARGRAAASVVEEVMAMADMMLGRVEEEGGGRVSLGVK